MNVGWLADEGNADGTIGGAELTERELARNAPPGTTITWMAPGEIAPADIYVIHNHTTFTAADIPALESAPIVQYHHDLAPHGDPALKAWLRETASHIFTSPAHARAAGQPHAKLIPPAITLQAFRDAKDRPGPRRDACWIGHFQTHGKGIARAAEWAQATRTTLHFYGAGPLQPPETSHVRVHGPAAHEDIPAIMRRHHQLVHLPTALEPFGRSVIEAWAAGLALTINRNVGAAWWIDHDPEALDTAPQDFWDTVTQAAC